MSSRLVRLGQQPPFVNLTDSPTWFQASGRPPQLPAAVLCWSCATPKAATTREWSSSASSSSSWTLLRSLTWWTAALSSGTEILSVLFYACGRGVLLCSSASFLCHPSVNWCCSPPASTSSLSLRLFQKFVTFRILVCGGDGSVGWVLSELDKLNLHKQVRRRRRRWRRQWWWYNAGVVQSFPNKMWRQE